MKVRNGFVSNSSSSSFVVIGYRLDELGLYNNDDLDNFRERVANFISYINYKPIPENFNEFDKDHLMDFLMDKVLYSGKCFQQTFGDKVYYLSDDGPGYLGYVLADISSDGCSGIENVDIELDSEIIQNPLKKLQECFGKKPHLYSGVRMT